MSYALTATVDRPFDVVIDDVHAALSRQGFGIVSDIDMQETLRTKIGAEIGRQRILGACNPSLAHRALQAEPAVGLLLPCNVVVREREGRVIVDMIDPETMAVLTANPAMQAVADEAGTRLAAALDDVRAADAADSPA